MSTALAVVEHNVTDMERMARAFAGSKLFGIQTPEQALALCLVAQAEGRHPASAAQDYHIINGRPAKKTDAMLRDFIANGGKVEWHALSDDVADATFSHPQGGSVRIAWDHKRAEKAGINNPMWKKYPRQMLRSRTVSEGVRTVYPMATSGMYVPEEVQDIGGDEPPGAPTNVTPIRQQQEPRQVTGPRTLSEQADDFEAALKACKTIGDLRHLDATVGAKLCAQLDTDDPKRLDKIAAMFGDIEANLLSEPSAEEVFA